MTYRTGDKVKAIQGTVTALFAEGRTGTIAEVRDPKAYSGNDSNNLIRWGDDSCLMGFRQEEVEIDLSHSKNEV